MIQSSFRLRTRTLFVPGLLGSVLILPVTLIILFAIWLAGASIVENLRFGHSVDQIIDIVSKARNFAVREQEFAMQPGEDILAALTHARLIGSDAINVYNPNNPNNPPNINISPKTLAPPPPPTDGPISIINPWGGKLVAVASQPSIIRIETAVPARDCRRLAIFFSKDVKGLGVQLMEARSIDQSIWRRFYDRQYMRLPQDGDVEAACDQSDDATLALVLRLR